MVLTLPPHHQCIESIEDMLGLSTTYVKSILGFLSRGHCLWFAWLGNEREAIGVNNDESPVSIGGRYGCNGKLLSKRKEFVWLSCAIFGVGALYSGVRRQKCQKFWIFVDTDFLQIWQTTKDGNLCSNFETYVVNQFGKCVDTPMHNLTINWDRRKRT